MGGNNPLSLGWIIAVTPSDLCLLADDDTSILGGRSCGLFASEYE